MNIKVRLVKVCRKGHQNPTAVEDFESWHAEIGTSFMSECQGCGDEFVVVEVVAL